MATTMGRRLALALFGYAGMAGTARALSTRRRIAFAGMPPDSMPTGFSFLQLGTGAPGTWTVAADPTLPGPTTVLAQTSRDTARDRLLLAVLTDIVEPDVTVLTRFRCIDGRFSQGGAVIARMQGNDTFYLAWANALTGEVRLASVRAGNVTPLGRATATIPKDGWHVLGLRVEADQMEVSFNGNPLFDVRNTTIAGPGRIGLATLADSATHFEFLQIDTLP